MLMNLFLFGFLFLISMMLYPDVELTVWENLRIAMSVLFAVAAFEVVF